MVALLRTRRVTFDEMELSSSLPGRAIPDAATGLGGNGRSDRAAALGLERSGALTVTCNVYLDDHRHFSLGTWAVKPRWTSPLTSPDGTSQVQIWMFPQPYPQTQYQPSQAHLSRCTFAAAASSAW